MKKLVFGDIHGCGIELERVIHKNPGCEYFAVGDLFDRNFHGVKVWELIHEHGIQATFANHEKKLLEYLEGRRDHLPPHYHFFLDTFKKKCKVEDLIEYLRALPLTIKLYENTILVHGGICLDDPWREDVSMNVHGRFNRDEPVPAYVDRKEDWWNQHDGDVRVICGHVVQKEPLVKKNSRGWVNSIHLDTGACHGGGLSYVILDGDNFEIKTEPSRDYFGELKKSLKNA